MKNLTPKMIVRTISFICILSLYVFFAVPAFAEEYEALKGLKGLNTVFDYANGSPEEALVFFLGIREVYQSHSVASLPEPSSNVIVFHNSAVKFLTTNRTDDKEKNKTLDKVAEMIRQFSKDGVKMKICIYAVKLFGIDPDTILPEIEKVPNGFISISGYQAKGYSLIAIP